MYRIMIVDDEDYFRQYLKSTIDWNALGFEIAGEAANGEEALTFIPQVKPDIVLADIHMAKMDGIAFSREVKSRWPYINIILITGYNEFEYAKQAIKIGVSNFLSKPFDQQELINSVLKIKNEIIHFSDREKLISTLKQQYSETIPLVRDSVLYRIVKGEYIADRMQTDMARLKISLPKCPAIVAVIDCEREPGEARGEERIKQEIKDALCSFVNIECVAFEHEGTIIGIMGIGEERFYGYFKHCCEKVVADFTERYSGGVSIGIGNVCVTQDQIPASYETAKVALSNKFLLGNNRVICYDSLKIKGTDVEIYPFQLKNDLLMYLRLLDGEKVQRTMSEIYNFVRQKKVTIDFVYILYTELLSNCFSCLAEYGYKTDEVFGDQFSPFERMLKGRTVTEVHEYIISVYMKVIAYLKDRKSKNSINAVKKAKSYIDENFSKSNLTVEKIAENVFFHPSYLRFIFKKEMGVTVYEYLTKVRMEHAKELLAKGGLNNTAVANMVGYSDPTYFSKCFKKCFKINPSDFEKNRSAT